MTVLLAAAVASASAELDRAFALESIGILRAADNVDGLFAEYVSNAYRDFFSKQSRFSLQDIGRADTALSRSKMSYQKLIEDPQILGQVARATRSESLIRTRVLKEGRQYRFTLEWLHSPRMEKMAEDSFVLPENLLGDVEPMLQKSLERVLNRVPFLGGVTGRDGDSVTVNLGAGKVFKGDILVISTLDEAKKHPLLQAVVDWRLTPVGKLEVESADERIAFCRVLEEEENQKITRYQKITQVIPAPPPTLKKSTSEADEVAEEFQPRLGWVAAGLGLGSFGRQVTPASAGATTGFSGGGWYLGPRVEAQLWINRAWSAEFQFRYGLVSYGQDNLETGEASAAGSVSSQASAFKLNAAYSCFLTKDFLGPKGLLRIGYQSYSYSFPISAAEMTAPIAFKSIFLGLGAEVPFWERWSAALSLDFGLFPGANETSTGGVASEGGAMIAFSTGASYRFSSRITFRGVLDIVSHSADFSDGLTLSHKVVAITPQILYYF